MTKMRIAKDKKTGRSRGFAYLDFDSKATAETAVAALAGLFYYSAPSQFAPNSSKLSYVKRVKMIFSQK